MATNQTKTDSGTLKDGVEFADCFKASNHKNIKTKEEEGVETDPTILEEQESEEPVFGKPGTMPVC